jgi:hypothetical protein
MLLTTDIIKEFFILEILFEISFATGIPEGSSVISRFLAELLVGWQFPDKLFVVRWPLDRLSKTGGFPAVKGSPEGAPLVGRSI